MHCQTYFAVNIQWNCRQMQQLVFFSDTHFDPVGIMFWLWCFFNLKITSGCVISCVDQCKPALSANLDTESDICISKLPEKSSFVIGLYPLTPASCIQNLNHSFGALEFEHSFNSKQENYLMAATDEQRCTPSFCEVTCIWISGLLPIFFLSVN